jgi:hypothetical protein
MYIKAWWHFLLIKLAKLESWAIASAAEDKKGKPQVGGQSALQRKSGKPEKFTV